MKLPSPQIRGISLRRLNRFAALVLVDGGEVTAHVPNSGRLQELFVPGNTVFLIEAKEEHRKTAYDLSLVAIGKTLVSADARIPNALVEEAFETGALGQFRDFSVLQREQRYGESRLDMVLSQGTHRCYIEIKSVTLVINGLGIFPDAPTARGRRHLATLMEAGREHHRAAIIFVIQRSDAQGFKPNDATDPAFGEALRRAHQAGVEVYAYRCRVSRREIKLAEPVPMHL